MTMMLADSDVRDPRTYAIIGAAMEVHRLLGFGFLEAVYQDALAIEFELRNIPFLKEHEIPLEFKGRMLKTKYRCDFLCYDDIVVELKALDAISGTEEAIMLNYLKGTKVPTGLLLNFGGISLEYRRYIFSADGEKKY